MMEKLPCCGGDHATATHAPNCGEPCPHNVAPDACATCTPENAPDAATTHDVFLRCPFVTDGEPCEGTVWLADSGGEREGYSCDTETHYFAVSVDNLKEITGENDDAIEKPFTVAWTFGGYTTVYATDRDAARERFHEMDQSKILAETGDCLDVADITEAEE